MVNLRNSHSSVFHVPASVLLLLLALVLLALPAAGQAQWNYTTNSGTITITKYIGPGGAVVIPDTIDGRVVTAIANSTFWGCHSLTDITIPSGVTSIGDRAFSYCTNLASVAIPDSVTHLGESVFHECLSLASVTIGNSVTSIGKGVFQFCASLTGVTIGNKVTNIGYAAFASCTHLPSITIPNKVTSIGDWAFDSCGSLAGTFFLGNAPQVSTTAFAHDTQLTAYFLRETTGWGPTLGGRPTALWKPSISISDTRYGVRTNQFGFTINWASDQVVVVEASISPSNPTWIPIGTNTLTDGRAYFSDAQWTNYPSRCYRVRDQ